MLKSKRANVLVAILAAICMWAYVNGIVDPTVTKKIVAVPITVINEDSLLQEGLAVETVDEATVDLVLEGSRADITKVDMDDVTVNADLYGRNKGLNSIKLEIEIPKGIKVESSTVEKLQVEIGEMDSRDFLVKTSVQGVLGENTVIGSADINPKYVKIYGTVGNLDKIASVDAVVEADKLSEENSMHQAQLKIRDANGKEVSFVKSAVSTVEVYTHIDNIKDVKLEVVTEGELPEGYVLENINVKENIRIQGPSSQLNEINKVYTEEVNLSDIDKTETIMVDVVLPEGVYTSEGSNKVEVKFVIRKAGSKELVYKTEEIEISNLAEGLTAQVKTDVTVQISATSDVLGRVSKDNTIVSVDLEGLGEGTHTVTATVKSNVDGISDMVINNDSIEVEIKKGN